MSEEIKFPPEMQARIDKGCCGAWCGQGWMPLVIELDQKLAAINPDYVIEQIKEKFGGLRYYVANIDYDEEVVRLITEAEEKSYTICEDCGSTEDVKTEGPGWVRTQCAKCRK